ncbi:MAG: HD-GYP domain-containing protein [Actinomycetota bacterium]
MPGRAKKGQPGSEPVLSVMIAEGHRTVAQSLAQIVSNLGGAEVAVQVHTADDALEVAPKLAPDVAIIDLDLSPGCSLVASLRQSCPETRIIVLADRMSGSDKSLMSALESGAVGAIYKEASLDELARALVSSSTDAPVLSDHAAGLLVSSYLEAMAHKRTRDLATIEALAFALEARDATTGEHVRRVTELATTCMDAIDPGLAKNEEVSFGFMLHDVGKIGVPDAILNKQGPLSDREWAVMQRHPDLGVKIVEPIGFSPSATDVILHHHERFDGSGYPAGLARDEIPLTARAFAVADAYDAMTNDRPYRGAMTKDDALEVISLRAGSTYDPEVVDVFVDLTA